MTIESTGVIDFIGIDKKSRRVVLTIVDHLGWSPKEQGGHLSLLQEKINTYMRFIEGGELVREYPAAKDLAVEILVISRKEMNRAGRDFFERAAQVLEDAGFFLREEKA